MDEVTQIGDERMLARVASEWREVCRWDEPSIFDDLGTLEYGPQSEPMSDEELAVAKDEALKMVLGERDFELLRQMAELWPTSMELWEAFQNMAAAFEELAGEHRIALGALRAQDLLIPPCPSSPGWYWVRGHWRSRAQNSAAIDPDQGTVQAAPGEGQTGASGDATGADKEQPCPGCGSYRGTHGLGCRILALTQSGEERSE